MENVRFGEIEARFADIVWEKASLTTRELIAICEKELNWKRTTTYTVLKKFCERGIFKTEDSIVSALVTREYYYTVQSEIFLKEAFSGSLPAHNRTVPLYVPLCDPQQVMHTFLYSSANLVNLIKYLIYY